MTDIGLGGVFLVLKKSCNRGSFFLFGNGYDGSFQLRKAFYLFIYFEGESFLINDH